MALVWRRQIGRGRETEEKLLEENLQKDVANLSINIAMPAAVLALNVVRLSHRTAPSAPTPAASVGVAIPRRIEPNTEVIKTKGGNRDVSSILHLPETIVTSCEGAIFGER